MKVTDKKSAVGSAGKAGSAGSSKKAEKSAGTTGGTQSGAVARAGVSVSSSSDGISASMANDSSQRAEKVASIRMDVQSGDYEPDSAKTAEKLLQNLTDYSLA